MTLLVNAKLILHRLAGVMAKSVFDGSKLNYKNCDRDTERKHKAINIFVSSLNVKRSLRLVD